MIVQIERSSFNLSPTFELTLDKFQYYSLKNYKKIIINPVYINPCDFSGYIQINQNSEQFFYYFNNQNNSFDIELTDGNIEIFCIIFANGFHDNLTNLTITLV